MAEATASVLALVTFGIKASSFLIQTIEEFKRAPKMVRQLKTELDALKAVLQTLKGVADDADPTFIELQAPLRHCAEACRELASILARDAGTSSNAKEHFQDWVKLKYHGGDLNGFKDTIAAYKSTISIALCSFNLRSSGITLKVFDEYKQMITETTYDLQSRLQEIEGHLQILVSVHANRSDHGIDVQRQVEGDKDAIIKCLQICDEVSDHIDTLDTQYSLHQDPSDSEGKVADDAFSAWVTAGLTLAGCKGQLQEHVDNLRMKLVERPHRPGSKAEEARRQAIVEEINGLQKSIDICNDAYKGAERHRTNVFEDVSMGDDARQVVVSTIGDLVFAKTLKTGARSVQVLGQMSDETVQRVSASPKATKAMGHSSKSAESYQSQCGAGREQSKEAKISDKRTTR